MTIRSFLAFELPPDIKREIDRISREVRRSNLNARWVKTENIHLTVIFMGNISEDEIPDIGTEVGKVCADFGPFDISLAGIGLFPDIRRPRVIWMGIDGEIKRLAYFRDTLQNSLKPFGIKIEKRRDSPHLTLGRFKKAVKGRSLLEDLVTRYRDIKGPMGLLNDLVLFRSDLKPDGARYSRIASWPLSGLQ
jgi:2'-5' RNA ligase